MKRPSFQFYPGDWLSSERVALMSLEEEGAYIRLLCYCWKHGSIPAEPEKIAILVGKGASVECLTNVITMFTKDPNNDTRLIHDRLSEERNKQDEWREKSSKGGKVSQINRWGNTEKKSRSQRLKEAREKGTHTKDEWLTLIEACKQKCVKCKCGASDNNSGGSFFVKDHIIPIYAGGSDSIDNIQPMCKSCNSGKTNKTIDYRPKDWKKCLTNVQPNSQPMPNTSSSSSSSFNKNIEPKDNKNNKRNTHMREFERLFKAFWDAYPKKKSKGQAEKAFKNAHVDEQLLEKILSTIERAKMQHEWTKEGGQFIPYPSTWLNAKGWEDEIITETEKESQIKKRKDELFKQKIAEQIERRKAEGKPV